MGILQAAENLESQEVARLTERAEAAERKAKLATEREKQLRKHIDQQLEELESTRAAKFSIPPAGKTRSRKGDFVRVIVADTHGSFIDRKACAAFLGDLEALNPAEVVFLGDHIDCAGWLAAHHPFKTVQEARYSFADDVTAANVFLDEVQKRTPGATYHYLIGNHEERIEAKIIELVAGNHADGEYMRRLWSPEVVLNIKERGINYYGRTQKHMGLRRRGIIKLGLCYFVHGTSHAKNAAEKHLYSVQGNIVFGHVHRQQSTGTTDAHSEYAAWCPGCLCEQEPIWKHSLPTDWTHGYAIQMVRSNQEFLHLNVPIIDGKSLLVPFTRQVA